MSMSSLLSSSSKSPSPASSTKGNGGQVNIICNAYKPTLIFSGLPLQIECITGYDDYVLVGTKEGHLLNYKINFNGDSNNSAPDIEIAYSNKYFSRKPIIQLDVIPEHKILISLTSDNGISTYDMGIYNCQLISTIERTKGATLFSMDIVRQTSLTGDPSITVRVCVVVGKRLQLFYWKGKDRRFHDLREDFAVPDTPRAIAWCRETLCLGFKNEYCLLHLLTGKQEDLFTPGKHGEPLIAVVSNNTFALVQDKISVLISPDRKEEESKNTDEKEKDGGRIAVVWPEEPIALTYDEPYLIGVLAGKGTTEVKTIKPKLKIESFQMADAKLVCRTKPGHVYVSSSNSIWCLKSTPADVQIDSFLKQKQFELALSLTNIWDEVGEEKIKKVNQIQNLYAFHLFCNKKFEDAMAIFYKLGTDPSNVIGLFPNLLPLEFRNQLEYPGTLPEYDGVDLENGLTALTQFLTSIRNILILDCKETLTASASIVEGGTTIKSKRQLLQIIDTTMLKCYLQTNESLVASLLRLKENYCHLEETERALKKHGKLNELIIMYQTRGLHKKALELLQKQNNIDRIIQYLQHIGREKMNLILEFAKPVLDVDPERGLKIFTEEDIPEVESLSRPRVYDFLMKNFKPLVIPYLEHVINVWEDKNSLFHNAFVHQYREKMQNETNPEAKEQLRARLLKFLKKSTQFTPEVVLVHFPYDDMYEERAIILERLGRHEQALSIYTSILKDVEKAFEYCVKVYDKNDPVRKEVFTILMRMLLNPPTTLMPGVVLEAQEEVADPDIQSAMRLLKNYAPYLEPIKALDCLPDDVRITDTQNFLKTSVQNHLSEKRKLLVQKGLVQSEYIRAAQEKTKCESERFRVSENTMCASCSKRLTNQSAFARYPDGSIVHYSCQPTNFK